MEILVLISILFGFYMAWGIGANDVANSMADAVGSRALTIFWAVVLAGLCEFLGSVLVGSHVTNTIRKGIVDPNAFTNNPQLLALGLTCSLLAAAVWLQVASSLGLPVSTTHSIIGAVVGFGLIAAGADDINWGKMGQIVASWFLSPLVGGLIAYFIFRLVSKHILSREKPLESARLGVPICVFFTVLIIILATIFKGLKNINLDLGGQDALSIAVIGGAIVGCLSFFPTSRLCSKGSELPYPDQLARVERIFGPLVVLTSCSVAFAHGANDVANAVGPLSAVFEIARTGSTPGKVEVQLWVLSLGGAGIVVGLATFGYRVMRRVGMEITEITPSRGVSADIATAVTVLACSRLALPISTTHTLVGAIIGVGLARGITGINARLVRQIFLSWLVTVPIAAVLSCVLFITGRLILF